MMDRQVVGVVPHIDVWFFVFSAVSAPSHTSHTYTHTHIHHSHIHHTHTLTHTHHTHTSHTYTHTHSQSHTLTYLTLRGRHTHTSLDFALTHTSQTHMKRPADFLSSTCLCNHAKSQPPNATKRCELMFAPQQSVGDWS